MSSSAIAAATPEMIARYEPVIGLEVHVQLATATKIFCGCPTGFGAPPNTNVCPVCLGLPGALPVLSREAVELAIKGALALNCQVRAVSRFARKNYFYPDLPKGYQISQYDEPVAEHGFVDIVVDGVPRRIGVTRVHMEDDAGKSVHDGFKDSDRFSYVDLNRSGTPLIEIVSEPDMRSADEAHAYLTELKQVIQFIEVSTCDMEKGHLRCDANVSVRLKGTQPFGTRAEVKNLNSFRFVKQALEHEIARHQFGRLRRHHFGDAAAGHHGVGLDRRAIGRAVHPGAVGGVEFLLHVRQRLVAQQPRNRQRHRREYLAVIGDGKAALHFHDLFDRHAHVGIVDTNDVDVVRVMADTARYRAGLQSEPFRQAEPDVARLVRCVDISETDGRGAFDIYTTRHCRDVEFICLNAERLRGASNDVVRILDDNGLIFHRRGMIGFNYGRSVCGGRNGGVFGCVVCRCLRGGQVF